MEDQCTEACRDYDAGQAAAQFDMDEHRGQHAHRNRTDHFQRGYDDLWFHTRSRQHHSPGCTCVCPWSDDGRRRLATFPACPTHGAIAPPERPLSGPVAASDGQGGHWTAENLPAELTAMLDAAAGREHSATGSVRSSLAAILNRYDEMLRTTTRTTPSDHLGACGHELDAWESHVEHHPECPHDAHGHPYEGCTCPEVCARCCLECRELDSTSSQITPS